MRDLTRLRKQIEELQKNQAERTPQQTPEEKEAEEIETLAALCAAANGEQDQRASTEHIRGLSHKERLNAYREAMKELARLWVESEEGQKFKALPYSEQVRLCMDATRDGSDILLIHGMRRAMRKW